MGNSLSKESLSPTPTDGDAEEGRLSGKPPIPAPSSRRSLSYALAISAASAQALARRLPRGTPQSPAHPDSSEDDLLVMLYAGESELASTLPVVYSLLLEVIREEDGIRVHPSKPVPSMIDLVILRLIEVGLLRSYSLKLCVSVDEIKYILATSRKLFLAQPVLLELDAPVKVVGDIHGQFSDLLRIFKLCGYPPSTNYLFLGDYVDRGKQLLETILLLLAYKIKYPNTFFMLRGNHECALITKIYGFYDEVKRRLLPKVWKIFIDTFNCLPIAAVVGDKVFCIHGGLLPSLTSLKQIKCIQRPTDIPDTGLLSDLLWLDPDSSTETWAPNDDRGVLYQFGAKQVASFCKRFGFDLVCRAHMVVEEGYEFFAKRRLVTVFSAPNYCGEFDNWGAVMSIEKGLLCSFELLKPQKRREGKKKKSTRA